MTARDAALSLFLTVFVLAKYSEGKSPALLPWRKQDVKVLLLVYWLTVHLSGASVPYSCRPESLNRTQGSVLASRTIFQDA